MIYKYTLSIAGDNFYPEKIVNKLQGDFIIDSFFSPKDKKFNNSLDEYDYGGISFCHPKKSSTEDKIIDYESDFVDFIEKNYLFFIENNVKDFEIFIEIYYRGGQCNFEIFNKKKIQRFGRIGMSLPVSVYCLNSEYIKKWESEIKSVWK